MVLSYTLVNVVQFSVLNFSIARGLQKMLCLRLDKDSCSIWFVVHFKFGSSTPVVNHVSAVA